MAARPSFTVQNSHGHAKKDFLNLYTIWARALKKLRQSCYS